MAVIIKPDLRDAPIQDLVRIAVQLKISGMGEKELIRQLKDETGWPVTLTWYKKRIESDPVFVETYEKLQKSEVRKNVNAFRAKCSRLLTIVEEKLEELARKGDIKAITLVLKSVGIETPEPESTQKQAQQITVVLPGAPKDVDAIKP